MRFKLLVIALVLSSGSVLGFSYYSKRQENVSQVNQQIAKRPDLPIVKYKLDTPEELSSQGQAGIRQFKRRARYNMVTNTKPELRHLASLSSSLADVTCNLPSTHTSYDPAMPVEISDSILIARVDNAEAFLSPDTTNVFSQFTATVSRSLKSSTGPIADGTSIILTRPGGVVKFDSGRTMMCAGCYQTMPLPGNTYIIFLKAFPATGDFEIITGYELNNGIVTPLDGRDLLNDQKLEKFTQ
jgi:hypothetical protein